MKDEDKTNAQLITELHEMRRRLSELEKSETVRMQAEKKLRKSEEQLRLITENTSDNIAITTFDLKATYVYVNPSVKSVLGYDPEDLLGKSFFDFIHPDDKKALFPLLKKYVNQKIKKIISGKEAVISERIEFRFKDQIGNWRFMQSNVNIIGKQLLAVTRDVTAQKQAEEALRQSEERLSVITEQSAEGITVANHKGDYIFVNPAFCKMMGYSKEELLNMTVFDMKKDKEEKGRKGFNKLKSDKGGAKLEVILQRKDKSTFISEVTGKPITIGDKDLVLGIVKDITERKQAEEALQKSKNKYRTLFEQSADAILIIMGDKFVDCNPATIRMLGYTNKKEFLETHPSQLSPETQPDGRNSFEKANEMMSNAFDKGSHRFEWVHKRRNGEVFPVEVLLTAIPFEEENFLHVVWRDITERKRAEEALKESEERNRILLDLAPDSFFHGDEKGNLIRVNAKAIELRLNS